MTDPPSAILDVDGTLVDSNYHHVVAWGRAFARAGLEVPHWRIHQQVGQGGDELVRNLAGEAHVEAVTAEHEGIYKELLPEVRPLPGARRLLEALKERGVRSVLATSARAHELDRYLEILDCRELLAGWTSAADVEESKPDPEVIERALAEAGGGPAVMVGDSPWDVETARRAGIDTIGLLTGGFTERELRDAGAVAVFESPADLARNLDRTPFSG